MLMIGSDGRTQMYRDDDPLAQEIYAGLRSVVMLDRILAIHILGDCGDEKALCRLVERLAEVRAEEEALRTAIHRLEARLCQPGHRARSSA